jgi:glucose 1-dehydrogenase/3-oxoacyl-[acyl-carrier protein] reductase
VSFDHTNSVAFVTGAGSGIGRATSLRLADEGAFVAAADIDRATAEETAAAIVAHGGKAIGIHADVRDAASIRAACAETLTTFGSIHLLVNNAGLVRMSSFSEVSEEEWDLVLDTNLKGMFLVTQVIAPAIAEAGGGAIVNLSTIEAEVVAAASGHPQVHYNASKGGVKMLTKALAVELAPAQIRVNAVAPGPIATAFVPGVDKRSDESWTELSQRLLLPRIGEPEDVAAAISFLLSRDASYITGVQLPVDGGWLAR